MRLLARAGARAPRPPLGVQAWDADGEALAVLLDGAAESLADVHAVARQIPGAEQVPPGTLVVVLGVGARQGARWLQWIAGRAPAVTRSVRCSALLARGYTAVGGGVDHPASADLAWGIAPPAAGRSLS
jgi:hypothetical protein